MARSPFSWSLPPGTAGDPNAPWNQHEGPCGVCGQAEDDCVCPECPVCGGVGDPACYDGTNRLRLLRLSVRGGAETELVREPSHGLIRSLGQVALAAEAERLQLEYEASLDRYAREFDEELVESPPRSGGGER